MKHVSEEFLPGAGLDGRPGKQRRVLQLILLASEQHIQLGLLPGAVLSVPLRCFAVLRRGTDGVLQRADVARLLRSVIRHGLTSRECQGPKELRTIVSSSGRSRSRLAFE